MLANGVTPVGCPTWVPEDYSLDSIDVLIDEETIKFSALYISNSRGELLIRITKYSDTTLSFLEKEDGGYTYTNGSIEFDIVHNLNVVKAGWQINYCVYSVTGPITSDEIKLIIDSVNI